MTVNGLEQLIERLLPQYRLVPGMTYLHPQRSSELSLVYFELEKRQGGHFSLTDRKTIHALLVDKLKGGLPRLVRPIFGSQNREDIYKNILLLSQEIESTQDIPHLMISLEKQEEDELVFSIIMAYASPKKLLNLEALFEKENPRARFVTQSNCPVTTIQQGFPVLAHVFHLYLQTDPNWFRTDGSLHFTKARKEVADTIRRTIGEFKDCNGGPIVKLDEQLSFLKDHFNEDPELLEKIFYSILPLQKETTLTASLLQKFFAASFKALQFRPTHKADYYFQVEDHQIVAIRLAASTYQQTVRASFDKLLLSTPLKITWSMVEIQEALSITLLLEEPHSADVEKFLSSAKEILEIWREQVAGRRVCRIALAPKETPTLDPRMGTDDHSSHVLRMLFEGLTRLGPDGKAEKGIAESISISSDGLHYSFKLRASTWNDGTPLSAHDFLYGWQKVLSPDFDLSFAYLFYPILNAQEIKEGKLDMSQLGAQAKEDHLLEIRLKYPIPYFLELLAHPIFSPISRHVDRRSPYWTTQLGLSYPCNGPFQLLTSHPRFGYQLVKNPHYWDASSCNLDQVVFLCIGSHEEARALFSQGEIDILGYPFTQFIPKNFGGEAFAFPEKSTIWCLLNNEKFPLNHLKFRQALKYATNCKELFTLLAPNAEFTSSPVQPGLSTIDATIDYDPKKALELLGEFLKDQKITLDALPPLVISISGKTIHQKIAYLLKECWEKSLNLRCKVEEGSTSGMYERCKQGDFQVSIMRWISYFHDPSYILNAFQYSSKVINFPRWTHALYQSLLNQAYVTQEREQRSLLQEAERILQEETPVIPLLHMPHICLKRPGTDGLFFTRCGFKSIEDEARPAQISPYRAF